jgi:hypothetical protein
VDASDTGFSTNWEFLTLVALSPVMAVILPR